MGNSKTGKKLLNNPQVEKSQGKLKLFWTERIQKFNVEKNCDSDKAVFRKKFIVANILFIKRTLILCQ